MNSLEMLIEGYNRIPDFMKHVLAGLSQEKLDWRPHPDSNSIGWLAWHLVRQHDAQAAALMDEEQIWISRGFHSRFDRPADPGDTGFGQTPDQVAAFKSPEARVFLEYADAVVQRSISYFQQLSEGELDRELDELQYTPLPTAGVRLVSILEDSQLHAGQAAYLRGLHEGYGWQKY
jgi:hypothetical protein